MNQKQNRVMPRSLDIDDSTIPYDELDLFSSGTVAYMQVMAYSMMKFLLPMIDSRRNFSPPVLTCNLSLDTLFTVTDSGYVYGQ